MNHPLRTLTVAHPNSVIDATVKVGNNVAIEPGVIIGKNSSISHNSRIGQGSRIGANVHIGAGCKIGARSIINHNCIIQPAVTVQAGVVMGLQCFVGSRCVIKSGVVMGSNIQLWGSNVIHEQTFIDDAQFIGEYVSLNPASVYRSVQGKHDSMMIFQGRAHTKFAKSVTIAQALVNQVAVNGVDAALFTSILEAEFAAD